MSPAVMPAWPTTHGRRQWPTGGGWQCLYCERTFAASDTPATRGHCGSRPWAVCPWCAAWLKRQREVPA